MPTILFALRTSPNINFYAMEWNFVDFLHSSICQLMCSSVHSNGSGKNVTVQGKSHLHELPKDNIHRNYWITSV
jgi:hypothetical protein